MGRPALTIAWAIWRRHCRGISAALGALAAMAVVYPAVFASVRSPAVLAISLLPPVWVVAFFMNTLLFTNNVGDLTSGYQRRLYSLPVRTVTLVTWPMLFAAGAAALLWIVFAAIFRRSELRPPLLLPALSLAALMSWLQALAWYPLAHRGARVVLAGALLPTLTAPVLWLWLTHRASPGQLALLLGGYCGAAYALALVGVSRDRRGDLSLVTLRRFRLRNLRAPRERVEPYGSPAAAQLAYEWRSHGMILPGFAVGLVAALLTAVLVLVRQSKPGSHLAILGTVLLLPFVLSSALGGNIARTACGSRPSPTFLMTRPMTSAGLAFAKFRMAACSVLVAWGLVGGVAALFVAVTGQARDVVELVRRWFDDFPGWKGGAVLLLALIAVLAVTWKQFTNTLVLRLTDQRWLMVVAESAKGVLFVLAFAVGLWLFADPAALARFETVLPTILPWLVGAAVVFKGCVAGWAYRTVLSRRLVEGKTVTAILGGWFIASGCLVGLAALVLPPEQLADFWPLVLLGVAAWMPLNRFALAPLALDWARHQ